MPAKKSAPARFSSNDWAKWVYLIGVIVAGLAGAFARFITPVQLYLGWLLLLAGILSGIFFLDSDDVVNFAIRYILLTFVAGGLKVLVFGSADVGSYFTGFFTGVVGFLTPVGLTLLVIYFWKKYFASMM